MSARAPLLDQLLLRGLRPAPAQTWGPVRLVPLLRPGAPGDLRLSRRVYGDITTVVSLEGERDAAGLKYVAYVPHALVVDWSDDGAPVAAFGTALGEQARDGKRWKLGCGCTVRVAHRMARRESGNRLRILPLHLAMEGFLAFCFDGPPVMWSEYAQVAFRRGLDPRWETAVSGRHMPELEDALRVFEIHDDQVGVLVLFGDSLGSAFVVSHPDDYRALHRTLLEDFYGETLVWHARYNRDLQDLGGDPAVDLPPASLSDLHATLARLRRSQVAGQALLSHGLVGRPLRSQRVYTAGTFTLERFITDLDPAGENHVGEAILRPDGAIEYLKTYRLSAAQVRRAYLLWQLSLCHWELDAAARALRCTRDEVMLRLDRAGFGYLLKPDVLAAARKRAGMPTWEGLGKK